MSADEIAKKMREAAKRATPGPWTREKPKNDSMGFAHGVAVAATYGRQTIYANPDGGSFPSADADHIAASNPENVLAVLAERDALKARVAVLEQTKGARDMTHAPNCHTWGPRYYDCLLREFEAACARMAELEEAIEPFAKVANIIDGPWGPDLSVDDSAAFKSGCAWTENGNARTLTWGDFRRASAALAPQTQESTASE